MKDTLLLNADYTPLQVLEWQRAVWLTMTHRVCRVQDYPGLFVRSSRVRVAWPAVVSLTEYVRVDAASITLSRQSVLARDGFTYQYCGRPGARHGQRPSNETLTVDHITPRSRARQGRVTLDDGRVVGVGSWQNLTAACRPCNHRKADRTPVEAGMPLAQPARPPTSRDLVRIAFARVRIEEPWLPYLPEGTGIRDAEAQAA